MSTTSIDFRGHGPIAALDEITAVQEDAGGTATEILITVEQHADVDNLLDEQRMLGNITVSNATPEWAGMTFRVYAE